MVPFNNSGFGDDYGRHRVPAPHLPTGPSSGPGSRGWVQPPPPYSPRLPIPGPPPAPRPQYSPGPTQPYRPYKPYDRFPGYTPGPGSMGRSPHPARTYKLKGRKVKIRGPVGGKPFIGPGGGIGFR